MFEGKRIPGESFFLLLLVLHSRRPPKFVHLLPFHSRKEYFSLELRERCFLCLKSLSFSGHSSIPTSRLLSFYPLNQVCNMLSFLHLCLEFVSLVISIHCLLLIKVSCLLQNSLPGTFVFLDVKGEERGKVIDNLYRNMKHTVYIEKRRKKKYKKKKYKKKKKKCRMCT